MRKVLILSKETAGGTRTFIYSLSKLSKLNKNFSILFYFYKKDIFDPLEEIKNVHYLNEKYFNNFFVTIILFTINVIKTAHLINKRRPDVLITLDYYSFFLFAFVSIFNLSKRTKWIATHHTDVVSYLENKPKLLKSILKQMLINFSNLPYLNIFVSFGIKDRFLKNINNKINYKVIYNGLNLSNRYKKYKQKLVSKKINLIMVGRLDRQKDYNTLLKTMQLLIAKRVKCKLYLVGDGPLKSELKIKVEKLKMDKFISIKGYVKNVYPYLKKSHIFLFSSFFEGFGYAILEAMSCGLPVIATNSPCGPAEILKDGRYGILVPLKDYKSFAKNILKLINNNNLYIKYAKLSLKRASYFSEKKMLESYLKIIR